MDKEKVGGAYGSRVPRPSHHWEPPWVGPLAGWDGVQPLVLADAKRLTCSQGTPGYPNGTNRTETIAVRVGGCRFPPP